MILVTGATGHIGRELVSQLLETAQPFRVLVRDPHKVASLGAQVERAVGDLNDSVSLASAMQDVSHVFLVTLDLQQDRNAVDIARRAGVEHIVKLSTLEATEHKIQVGKWHYEREELIRSSGLGWTFLRPGMFMTNAADWWSTSIRQQSAVYFPGGKGRVAPVHPADVAAMAACALTDPRHNQRIYELTGPDLMTMREMVQVIGKVLAKRLKYQDIPPFAAKFWMLRSGMDRQLVDALMEMLASLRHNEGAIVTDAVQQVTGRPPQTFDAWCRQHLSEFQSEQ